MTITAAIVVYAVTWFMVFFCVLPLRFRSQADEGRVELGTPASAPENAEIGKKAKITSVIALAISVALYLAVVSERWTIADLDVFGLWANRY